MDIIVVEIRSVCLQYCIVGTCLQNHKEEESQLLYVCAKCHRREQKVEELQ